MKQGVNDFNDINEDSFKKNLNESLKTTNNLPIKERDYMISTAMRRLHIESKWHNAVARGACYLDGVRFWELVDYAEHARKPANCFVFCIGRELEKAGL